jgi:arginase
VVLAVEGFGFEGVMGTKRVKIIGVPVDLGARPLGVDMGPAAIRYAGLLDALRYNEIEYLDYGNMRIDRPQRENGFVLEIAEMSEELAGLTEESIGEGYVPIILGGDHSASIGSVAGSAKNAGSLGLLWLDYHPDANTPETSPSGNVHGMTVAISLGYGYDQLVRCGGFSPKLPPRNICIVGAKDVDRGEREFLQRLGVKMFTLYDVEKQGIFRVIEEALNHLSTVADSIHVSLDVDVLDPVIAPGTGILSRGGLSYREIMYVMETLGGMDIVRSLDVIEVNPLLDIRNQTAELAVELILAALGGAFGDYERDYLGGNLKKNHQPLF